MALTRTHITKFYTLGTVTGLVLLLILPNLSMAQFSYSIEGPQPAPRVKQNQIQPPPAIHEWDLRPMTTDPEEHSNVVNAFRTKPGLAMLGSAILPGTGQAINKKWWRAGLYAAIEAATLGLHLYFQNEAERQEREYIRYANSNWSVVNYAKWLVDYNNYHNGTSIPYSALGENIGDGPAYDTSIDWDRVDLSALRALERNTVYYYSDGTQGQTFSHVLPDYGSQQYYELISKYYQFGTGWNDFGTTRDGTTLSNLYRLPWDGSAMPANFYLGADKAETFNDNYRHAGNLITLLLANHIASAIDAFFTVKLTNEAQSEQHTIDPSISFSRGTVLNLKYNF
jgi:hypothetical protein